jgi:urea ABC transporter ATP-binding protein UrtD
MCEPLLKTENIVKHFGGIQAMRGVSLKFFNRKIYCIIGPNGAGKSTFFNIISGMLKPSAGRIIFENREIVGLPIYEYARIGITRKFQVPSVFENMTVRENLEVALHGLRSNTLRAERISFALNITRLEDQADTQSGKLSHGQKQWLEIGMAVAPQPKLLLLDEPTAGMSMEETQKTVDLLLGLKGDFTVIVIEHDMRFVRSLDSHTIVIHQGKVLKEGNFAEISGNDTVREVYLGRR